MLRTLFIALVAFSTTACAQDVAEKSASANSKGATSSPSLVVAGGCFWCVESDLEKLRGVGDVLSGYAGGESSNPTYTNHTGHLEVVQAPYDPEQTSYREILDYFLRHIDPLDAGGQFCDRGHSYTTAIFYRTAAEKEAAEAAVADAERTLGQKIVTPVRALDEFWIAEDYHQNYYKENPLRYRYYRARCGRDDRVEEVWGEHTRR